MYYDCLNVWYFGILFIKKIITFEYIGTLAFFDDEVQNYQHMGSFELSWKTGAVDIADGAQFSQRLKIVSKCSMITIPPYFLTDSKMKLTTHILSSEDEITEDFMKDPDMFGPHNCVIAKLER